VRIISVKKLKDFWRQHPDVEQQLKAWYSEVTKSEWKKFSDITKHYKTVSILNNNRVVFRIKGNRFRIIVAVRFDLKIVFIRFIGTHSQYDKINAEEI
jgi:mRNA interferase HigB